jgi:hypothetical protein
MSLLPCFASSLRRPRGLYGSPDIRFIGVVPRFILRGDIFRTDAILFLKQKGRVTILLSATEVERACVTQVDGPVLF